ncbi:MAG: hypothetical protein LBR67_03150 [Dysgonamonadaceae bacterium]|nr:hypothetical protein [Dysgonamonadaceae bacterium]
MKDIIITVKKQRAELMIYGVCLLAAFVLNVASIIIYNTEWKELYTQLLWVFCLSVGIYFLTIVFRVLYWLIRRLFQWRN